MQEEEEQRQARPRQLLGSDKYGKFKKKLTTEEAALKVAARAKTAEDAIDFILRDGSGETAVNAKSIKLCDGKEGIGQLSKR